MQDLVALFGSVGAARYLELCAAPYRKPCWELHALEDDAQTLRLDLTEYLASWGGEFSDETGVSQRGDFSLANPGGLFDLYDPLSATADVLREGRYLRFRKGLTDPLTGTKYLLPAFFGTIMNAEAGYTPGGETAVKVNCGDVLRWAVKQKITSDAWLNTAVDRIAAGLLERFGGPYFAPDRLAFTPLPRAFAFVQFPDYALLDALKTLYEPFLFWVRADEAGRIATGPRLGSGLSAFAGLKGWPDQAAAPAVPPACVVADALSVTQTQPRWQDWDNVPNQVKVLGEASAAEVSLGPNQRLFTQSNSSIDSKGKSVQRYPFRENGGGERNQITAKNVYVRFEYSTNKQLDENARVQFLTLMRWRGPWDAATAYAPGDAVSVGVSNWACVKDAPGGQEPGEDSGEGFWEPIPFGGPFRSSFTVFNEDPREVGFVRLESVTPGDLILRVEGRQYSVGQLVARRRGGFDYRFSIWGQPVLSFSRTLTAYADYDAQPVTGQALSDVFGDRKTYQAPHRPLAMSVPVEVFKDGASLGTIAADQTDLSGEGAYSVDFERGRIVLNDLAYQEWLADSAADNPFSTGGIEYGPLDADVDPNQTEEPAPLAVLLTGRRQDSVYTFTGLDVGLGYDIRLHFADTTSSGERQRVFSVFCQGVKSVEGLDLYKRTGARGIAHVEEVSGVAPDNTGKIVLRITQHDPVSGALLPECSHNGDGSGGAIGEAIISAIEVRLGQGQGASPFAVNCGGEAILPTPPVITADYGYSPVQQHYQVQGVEINNPLIGTHQGTAEAAGFHVLRAAWRRHPHTISCASLPHVQPGDLLRYHNPLKKPTAPDGTDVVLYVESVKRGAAQGGADTDTFSGYLIHLAPR